MRERYQFPPDHGPRSSRTEWKAFAYELVELIRHLNGNIDERNNELAYLRGEVELLRKQVAERKPAGARDVVPAATVKRIEAALQRGESTRFIAKQFGVSAMTASRIKKRMKAREQVSVT